jgi:hypothetical protein
MMNPFEQLSGPQLVNPFEQEKTRRAATAAKAKPEGRSVYEPLARKIAEEEGVDPELFTRLIQQESAWDPKAVSKAGAQGLGQVMPLTWGDLDKGRGGDPFDPETNLRYSAKYLADQVRRFGDPRTALAAYNAGPGAVQKHGGVPPYKETQDYVTRIWDNWEGKTQTEGAVPRAGSAAARTPQEIIKRLGTVNPFEEEKARRAAAQPVATQKPEEEVEVPDTNFGAGLSSSWRGLQSLRQAAKIAAGSALGKEEWVQSGLERYKQLEGEMEKINEGKAARLEDIKDHGFIDWFTYQAGAAIPSILESAGAALLGAAAGSVVPGAGTAATGVAGLVAKQSVKKMIAEYGEAKAKQMIARRVGAGAFLYVHGYSQGLGDVYGEIMEEETGEGDVGLAALTALPYAAADALTELLLLGKVIKGTEGANILTRYVKAITVGATTEAASEASQEAMVMAAGMLDGKEYSSDEVVSRLANAAASAAVAGGMVGAVGGRQGGAREEKPGTPRPDATPEDPNAAIARIRLEAEQAAQVMRERGAGEADIEAMRANYETALTVFDQEGLKELPEEATKLPAGYQEMYDSGEMVHPDQKGFTPRWENKGYADLSIFESSLYNEAGVSLKDWLANPDSTSFVGLPSRAALEYNKTFGTAEQKQNVAFIENGKSVIDEITASLSSVVQKYAPKMKVVVDISPLAAERLDGSLGAYHYDTRLETAYIELNPKMLSDARSMQSIGTVAHEFGHALQWGMLKQADAKVKNAIVADYHAHLREFADKTPKEWTDGTYESTYAYGGENDPKSKPRYHYSFEEWFANQVARKIMGDHLDNLQSPVRQFIERVAKAFTEFYDKVRGTYRAMPAVEVWMEGLAARNALIREGVVLDNAGFLGSEAQAGAVVAGDKQPVYQGEISPTTIPTNPDTIVVQAQDPTNSPWESADPTAQIAEEAKYDQQTDGKLKQLSSKLGSEQLAEHVKGMDMSWGKLMLSSMRWAMSAPQVRQQFEKYIPALAKWVNLNYEWSQTASQIIQPADRILSEWRNFNKHAGKQKDVLAQFLLYATDFSFKNGIKLRRLNDDDTYNQRFLQELKVIEDKVGVKATEETLALWEKIDKSLRDTIVEAKRALVYELANEFSTKSIKIDAETVLGLMSQGKNGTDIVATVLPGDADVTLDYRGSLVDRIDGIIEHSKNMEAKNYFPWSRFGKHVVSIYAGPDGVQLKSGKRVRANNLVAFYQFDSKIAAKREMAALQKELGEQVVKGGIKKASLDTMDDKQYALAHNPMLVLKNISANDKLGLAEWQIDQVRNMLLKYHPGMSFLKHLQKRKGTLGYSQDVMRAYADYFVGTSNHIGRIKTLGRLNETVTEMDQQLDALRRSGEVPNMWGYTNIVNYVRQQVDYRLNPSNDYAHIRGLAFTWFLGFNPASAYLNLSQIPLATLPKLASDEGGLKGGDVKAAAAITSAVTKTVNRVMNKGNWEKKTQADTYSKKLQEMIDKGMTEQWLDESYAANAAGTADGFGVMKYTPMQTNGDLLLHFAHASSFLFHHAEKFNRAVSATAAFDMELNRRRKAGKALTDADYNAAMDYAKSVVLDTQFEYAKWARAPFMRGKAAVPLIFFSYIQGMSYLAFGGAGKGAAVRVWLALLVLAGMEGLPWSGLIDMIVNFFGKQMNEPDLAKNLKEEVAKVADLIGIDPDLAMNGLASRYGLGPLHLANAVAPGTVPDVDLSGSLSMKWPHRGLEQAGKIEGDQPWDAIGRTLVAIGGPAFALPINTVLAMASNEPDLQKRWEQAMPTVARNASQALRWADQGYIEGAGQNRPRIVDDIDLAHPNVLAKALGFPPGEMTEYWRAQNSLMTAQMFWQNKRNGVLQLLKRANLDEDPKAWERAKKNWEEFNEAARKAGLPGAIVTHEQVRQSIVAARKDRIQREQGVPNQKMWAPLYYDMQETLREETQ